MLRKLSQEVKVVCRAGVEPPSWPEGIVRIEAKRTKGCEYEGCVLFRVFAGRGEPTSDELFLWYMAVTRARSRLLIVATTEEIDRVGRAVFCKAECEFIPLTEAPRAAAWIGESVSDVDVTEIRGDVEQRILAACRKGRPFYDTYEALQLAGANHVNFGRDARDALRDHPEKALLQEAEKTDCAYLRTLLFWAAGRSWQAAEQARRLERRDQPTCHGLVRAIAADLAKRGLPYEAERIRVCAGLPSEADYPYPEALGLPGPLVVALCQAFENSISDLEEDH